VAVLLLSALLLARAAVEQRAAELVLAGLAGAVAAVAAAVVVPRSLRALMGGRRASPWQRLLAVVCATVLLAVAGLVAALVSAGAHDS
jgi:hypothetical protein